MNARSPGRIPLRASGIGLVVALTACGSGSIGGSSDGPFDTTTLPTVVAELELQVGSVDAPDYSLTRFTAMEVDGAGRMFTLHLQEQLVRVFSPDGMLERVFGSQGEGPGEFQSPVRMGWVVDSLWVLDAANGRFSFFDSDGTFLSSFSVPFRPGGEAPPPQAGGLLTDGRVYGSPPLRPLVVAAGAETERQVMLLERDGAVTDTIGAVPLGRVTWGVQNSGRNMFFVQPFSDSPMERLVPDEEAMVVMDRRIAVDSDSATYTVSKLTFARDTVFSVRLTPAPVVISDAQVEEVVEPYVVSLENTLGLAPADARTQLRANLFRPLVRPGAQDLLVTPAGEIWIQEVAISPNAQWVVLGPDGEPRFRLELPGPVDIIVAGGTEAWGRLEDELGVPYLVRYRFERP